MPPAQQQRTGAIDNAGAIQWLKDNYEACATTDDTGTLRKGVPRASVYERYQKHYSRQQGASDPPINAATFGKLLRNVFPNITTRRLGHRGESKYYYCGINEVDTQETADEMNLDTDNEQISIASVLPADDHSDSILPPFEAPGHHYSDGSWQEQAVNQLTQMYHQHCKCLLNAAESHKNISEQIIAFYKTMPRTIFDLLQSDSAIGEELCIYDCILYDAVILTLYPTLDAAVDISTVPHRISEWSSTLLTTLPKALEGYPEELTDGKITVAKIFNAKLERIVHLNALIQTANQAIQKNSARMINIWQKLDLQQLFDRAQWITGVKDSVVDEQFGQIGSLLKSTEGSKNWIVWMDAMMEMHLARGQNYSHIKKLSIIWSTYTSLTRREMELLTSADASASVLDSFEKLWVFTNDYILYLIEQETAKRNSDALLAEDYSQTAYNNHRTPDDYVSTTTNTPNTTISLI